MRAKKPTNPDGWFCKPTYTGMYIAYAFAGVMIYLWIKLKNSLKVNINRVKHLCEEKKS